MNYQEEYFSLLEKCKLLEEEVRSLREKLSIEKTTLNYNETEISQTAITENVSAKITKRSTPEEKISLFKSLFKGRENVFAKRWQSSKSEKSGYSPVCVNEWDYKLCNKKKYKCSFCPNRKLAQLTDSVINEHLTGIKLNCSDVIGLYPMTEDECCYFLAADFDGENWNKDISAFKETCKENGITAHIERSRSGNGGHAWFFFECKIPAITARKFGCALLTNAMQKRHSIKFDSYDRLFPNQDTMPKGGFGNLIALPLQGKARKNGNSVFVDDNFAPYADQWAYLSGIEKLSVNFVEEITRKLSGSGTLGVLSDDKNNDEGKTKPWEKDRIKINLSASDFPPIVRIIRANMIWVEKNGITERALNKIKRLGAFKNSQFYKAQKMRLSIAKIPRIISTAEETEEYIGLPRACENELVNLLVELNISYETEDKTEKGIPIKVSFNGELREEQKIAFEELAKHNNGVLSATTAFGKTVIGAKLIAEKKVNTLILVHTAALLNQWKNSLDKFLTFEETVAKQTKQKRKSKKETSNIGLLGAGKNTVSGNIDIAIMQSLTSGDDVKEFVKNYGMVIADECHHIPAFSFEKILKAANANFVYGLTATPIRQDGHQAIIFMQCGNIRYKVDAKEQAEKRSFNHYIIPRFTTFRMPLSASGKEPAINDIFKELCGSSNRNELIINDILSAVADGRNSIVFTERSAHAEYLANELEKRGIKIFLLIGAETAKVKRDKIAEIASTDKNSRFVIVATGKYAGEGFDVARLDTLFLAMPISWKGKVAQYAGRLHRNYEGKNEVLIYDYVDINVKMLENMYHKRISGYKEIGYDAKIDNGKDKKTSILFDNKNFASVFAEDLENASGSIFIVSPYLKDKRIEEFLKIIENCKISRNNITIMTRPPEEFNLTQKIKIKMQIDKLTSVGIKVVIRSHIHQKYAIIDNSLIWYGSINLLSYTNSEESIMRFESNEIAEELGEENLLNSTAKIVKI